MWLHGYHLISLCPSYTAHFQWFPIPRLTLSLPVFQRPSIQIRYAFLENYIDYRLQFSIFYYHLTPRALPLPIQHFHKTFITPISPVTLKFVFIRAQLAQLPESSRFFPFTPQRIFAPPDSEFPMSHSLPHKQWCLLNISPWLTGSSRASRFGLPSIDINIHMVFLI